MRKSLFVGLAIALITAGGLLSLPRTESFPHARHAGLFPSCLGCHEGIDSGDTTAIYSVTPQRCGACHNGSIQPEVEWTTPSRRPSNLKFTHAEHPKLECKNCHQTPGATEEMDIQFAAVDRCLVCHAPTADGHQAMGVSCDQCHVTLADAEDLTDSQIAALPQPDDHLDPNYIFQHGDYAGEDIARCSVCHVQESCTRCHINADEVAPIQALESSSRVATVVGARPPSWPTPASHESSDWSRAHGAAASESIETCANCHAQASCQSCHGRDASIVAAALPSPPSGGPQGVLIAAARPPFHTSDWVRQHGTAGTTGLPNCAACHTQSYCLDCHDGPDKNTFHPDNFVLQHGAEAYAERTECASCHSTEVFCRTCHTSSGAGVSASSGNAFHDAQPDWLIVHGRAARQGMEECTTCHQQTSCLRCHSARAGWRINPHGPDFDAERIAKRSTESCSICHTSGQITPGD